MDFTGKFAVSTDSTGLFGLPADWAEVWDFVFPAAGFLGFEAIGWRWIKLLLKHARAAGYRLAGVHGRMSGKGVGYDHLLINTPTLLSLAATDLPYILIHAPELQFSRYRELILKNPPHHSTVFIENHTWPGSVGAALEIAARLRQAGVKTGIMVDIVHYLKAYPQEITFTHQWQRALKGLRLIYRHAAYIDPGIALGLHLPVGTRTSDSLPVDQFTDPMWRALGETLAQYPQVLRVVENQQEGSHRLRTTRTHRQRQRDRNRRLVDRLLETGIIPG